jgi:hypothetical protein
MQEAKVGLTIPIREVKLNAMLSEVETNLMFFLSLSEQRYCFSCNYPNNVIVLCNLVILVF